MEEEREGERLRRSKERQCETFTNDAKDSFVIGVKEQRA